MKRRLLLFSEFYSAAVRDLERAKFLILIALAAFLPHNIVDLISFTQQDRENFFYILRGFSGSILFIVCAVLYGRRAHFPIFYALCVYGACQEILTLFCGYSYLFSISDHPQIDITTNLCDLGSRWAYYIFCLAAVTFLAVLLFPNRRKK